MERIPTFDEFMKNRTGKTLFESKVENRLNFIEQRLNYLETIIDPIKGTRFSNDEKKPALPKSDNNIEIQQIKLYTSIEAIELMLKFQDYESIDNEQLVDYKRYLNELANKLQSKSPLYEKSTEVLYTYLNEVGAILDKAEESVTINVKTIETEGLTDEEKVQAIAKLVEQTKAKDSISKQKEFIVSIKRFLIPCYQILGKRI